MAGDNRCTLPWVVSAILSLVVKTAGLYILGKQSVNVWGAILMLSFGFFTFGIILAIIFWITASQREKRCLGICDSSLVKWETVDDKKSWKIAPGVWIGTIAGAFTLGGEASLQLGLYFDPQGQGITTSLLAGAAILSAFGTWCMYGEKLSCSQIVGIIAGTVGILFITLESAADGTYPAIIGGFCSLVFFSIKNISSRAVSVAGLDSDTNGVLNLLSSSILGFLGILIVALVHIGPFEISIDYGLAYFAGILIAAGAYLLNESMMVGMVGPPAAIINTMGVWMVIVDLIMYGYEPTTLKIIGMIIAIIGAIVLLVGDIILYKGGCHKCVPDYMLPVFNRQYAKTEMTEGLIEKKEP